jgi:hypothetical protein
MQRFSNDKIQHVSQFPYEILAMFFSLVNFDREKKAFVNFWIACFGYGNLKLKLREALGSIDVPICLEKTPGSLLSEFLTDISFAKKSRSCDSVLANIYPNLYDGDHCHVAFLADKLNFILSTQKQKSRVKSLDIEREGLPHIYKQFSKAENVFWKSMRIDWHLLQTFANIRSLDANFQPLSSNNFVPLQNLQELRNIRIEFENFPLINSAFPNLVVLTFTYRTTELEAKKFLQPIDLSNLKYLQEFGWYYSSIRSELYTKILFSGKDLRRIHIFNNLVIETTDTINNTLNELEALHVSCLPTNVGFGSQDLVNSPKLKHLILNAGDHIFQSTLLSKQIEHLELRNFGLSDRHNFQNQLKECGALNPNIKKVSFVSMDISEKIITFLPHTFSNITHLVWCEICTLTDGGYLHHHAPVYNLPNLIHLKGEVRSAGWEDSVRYLAKIESLHLTVIPKVFTIRTEAATTVSYTSSPINVQKFLTLFHVERLKNVKLLINSEKNHAAMKLCKNFIFEELDVDKLTDSCIKTHNEDVIRIYPELSRLHNRENWNFMLQFIHRLKKSA